MTENDNNPTSFRVVKVTDERAAEMHRQQVARELLRARDLLREAGFAEQADGTWEPVATLPE